MVFVCLSAYWCCVEFLFYVLVVGDAGFGLDGVEAGCQADFGFGSRSKRPSLSLPSQDVNQEARWHDPTSASNFETI